MVNSDGDRLEAHEAPLLVDGADEDRLVGVLCADDRFDRHDGDFWDLLSDGPTSQQPDREVLGSASRDDDGIWKVSANSRQRFERLLKLLRARTGLRLKIGGVTRVRPWDRVSGGEDRGATFVARPGDGVEQIVLSTGRFRLLRPGQTMDAAARDSVIAHPALAGAGSPIAGWRSAQAGRHRTGAQGGGEMAAQLRTQRHPRQRRGAVARPGLPAPRTGDDGGEGGIRGVTEGEKRGLRESGDRGATEPRGRPRLQCTTSPVHRSRMAQKGHFGHVGPS